MSDIQTGFMLLAIGFPTVFLILWLVILLGKGLVLIVNKYVPEKIPAGMVPEVLSVVSAQDRISPSKVAAVVSAVNLVTGGKARITAIEKL